MTTLRIGCADLPAGTPLERYFATFDLLETTLCLKGVPADKVVKRWRAAAPARGYAAVAPLELRDPAGFAAAAEALDAGAVVFRTGDTPSTVGRDALRRLFAELAPAERYPGRDRVWQPGPLWELPASARFAAELGVLCAIDPLAQDPGADLAPALIAHLERGAVYFRPSGMGRRALLPMADLEALAALLEPVDRAYLVFANGDPAGSARAFKTLWAAGAGDGDAREPDEEDDLDGEDDLDEEDDLDDDE